MTWENLNQAKGKKIFPYVNNFKMYQEAEKTTITIYLPTNSNNINSEVVKLRKQL